LIRRKKTLGAQLTPNRCLCSIQGLHPAPSPGGASVARAVTGGPHRADLV
jgi:hypothetical protein